MSDRSLLASIVIACALAVGASGIVPAASAELGRQSVAKRGKSAKNHAFIMRRRVRGVRIYLPIGPSYIYYDYPYYYSRGYYPRHIGGYVYYPPYHY
jgi:hypothetical protein